MSFRKAFPLVTALWLQFAPLLARLESVAATLANPVAMLLRWIACGTAVSGAFHAVSGATGLTVTGSGGMIPAGTPIVASKGSAFTVRFSILSSHYGVARAYTYANLPPGLTRASTKTDTVQGTPTTAGQYVTTVRGWDKANASGDSFATTVIFTVQAAPPVVTVQPVSRTVDPGGSVTFSVTATGEAPLTYQWFKEDVQVVGKTASLTLANITSLDAGRYRVRVGSSVGSTLSDFATLTVNLISPPQILSQPTHLEIYVGEAVELAIVLAPTGSGVVAPTINWQKDGMNLPAASAPTYAIASAAAEHAGQYVARIVGPGGTISSAPITVVVAPRPVLEAKRDIHGVSVVFTPLPGREYVIETQSIVGGPWTVRQNVAQQPAVAESVLPANLDLQFFRLRVVPLVP